LHLRASQSGLTALPGKICPVHGFHLVNFAEEAGADAGIADLARHIGVGGVATTLPKHRFGGIRMGAAGEVLTRRTESLTLAARHRRRPQRDVREMRRPQP
jgi:hypothetical protein